MSCNSDYNVLPQPLSPDNIMLLYMLMIMRYLPQCCIGGMHEMHSPVCPLPSSHGLLIMLAC